MSRLPIALAALALVSACPVPRPPDADALIAAFKAASGGAAWDAIDGLHERGTHGATPYETWLDFRHYGMRSESGSGEGLRVSGFNGHMAWRRPGADAGGSDPAALAEAVTTAFCSNNGFFFPDRFPMTARYLRADAIGTRAYDVVEVTPQGGRAFELWFDRETHLMGRLADPHGTPAVNVDVSDYRKVGRKVGAVLFGFHGVISLPDGTKVEELNVASVEFGPVDRSRFDPPPAR